MEVRKATFAGSWYPATGSECEREIRKFVDEDELDTPLGFEPLGGVVPHAGWYYSGRIACNVIRHLAAGGRPDVVIVFGMHLHTGSANYIMAEGAWETPFGSLTIASDLADRLTQAFSFRVETPQAHTEDNTIELQLPFVKYFFDNVEVLPMGVPPVGASLEIGEFAVAQAKDLGLSVKVLGSTDLTHYGMNYGFSPKGSGNDAHEWVRRENDRRVIDAMLSMDPQAVLTAAEKDHNACCAGAAATAIAAAKKLGSDRAIEAAYATSYEKRPSSSFVGYVGILC